MNKLWITEKGKLAICQNGKLILSDSCPCGCSVLHEEYTQYDTNTAPSFRVIYTSPVFNESWLLFATGQADDALRVISSDNIILFSDVENGRLSTYNNTLLCKVEKGKSITVQLWDLYTPSTGFNGILYKCNTANYKLNDEEFE